MIEIEVKTCQECGLNYVNCPKTNQFEHPSFCSECEFAKMKSKDSIFCDFENRRLV